MNKNSYQTAILIVTHNHRDYVSKLIDSCKNVKDIPKYICDAASTDGTLEVIENETNGRPDFFILKKQCLESFSKNNNDLIRTFNLFDYNILLVNPDCFFEEESIRNFLEKSMLIDNLGVSAPELYFPNGTKQITWRKYPSAYNFFYHRLFSPRIFSDNHYVFKELDNSVFHIEWAIGAFLFISRALIARNNNILLDERYRLYCEDADLCLTAYSYGLSVVGIAQKGIYHALQEKSSSKLSKYNYWNIVSGLKFMTKWNLKYKKLIREIGHPLVLKKSA